MTTWKSGCMHDDWTKSVIVQMYKVRGVRMVARIAEEQVLIVYLAKCTIGL